MSKAGAGQPLLDAEHAAFISGGVAIAAASRDAANVPTLAHACGCRVSADHRRVTVFVRADGAAPLLDAVRATGAFAVVFCQPSTARTIQLKGTDAMPVDVAPADCAHLPAYVAAMIDEVAKLGFSEAYARVAWEVPLTDLAAIAFTPTAAYVQTPGPRAGTPLPR